MPNESTPITTFCPDCGHLVVQPPHLAGDLPKSARHIGVPGEPVDCPE